MYVIGTSSAAEAVSTPSSDVWMTREGEAPTCRSQARKGAHDKGRIAEEPCEVETLMHGSEAETGGAVPSPTVTGRSLALAPLSSGRYPENEGVGGDAVELGW
jgi:hypothetical protein